MSDFDTDVLDPGILFGYDGSVNDPGVIGDNAIIDSVGGIDNIFPTAISSSSPTTTTNTNTGIGSFFSGLNSILQTGVQTAGAVLTLQNASATQQAASKAATATAASNAQIAAASASTKNTLILYGGLAVVAVVILMIWRGK